MRKIIKNIAKTLSIALIFAFVCLPLAACSKDKNANKNLNTNIENISTDKNAENAENQESSEENTPAEEPEEEKITLNGIYKVSKTIDYKDIWYENEEETIKYFETRDINGVYNALRKLGFKENTTFKKTIDEKTYEVMFRFTKSKVHFTLAIDENEFFDIDTYEYDNIIHKIEIDENESIYAYIQFTYEDESGNTVKTPAFIKCPLTFIENTDNIFVGQNYIYKEDSAIIKFSNDAEIDNESATNKLASLYEIDEACEDKFAEIISILNSENYNLSADLSKLTITDELGYYKFSTVSDNIYTFKLLNLKLESRQLNITTNVEELVFTIQIDNNSTFEFTCVAE